MKLGAFVHDNLDAIVGEWQEFARTLLPAARTMSDLALRNHSREILVAIVKDMEEVRTDAERSANSRRVAPPPEAAQTIAAAHGALRYAAGFDLAQVVSEFRALRASVLALWARHETPHAATAAIEEIARFNEAIDQALGESVERYSAELAQARDMFLAVLGHDLRSPLAGIEMSGRVLEMPALSETARVQTALRVRRASKTMSGLIADLLEYTQSRLGRGIPIERSDCDLHQICEDALDAIEESHPEQQFVQHLSGDLRISLDVRRIQQMLSNLLDNAAHHGDRNAPVSLAAHGAEDAVVLEIANSGTPIPADALKVIFEPMVQVPSTTTELHRRPKTSVGLGLFIVREIVRGHHGTIDVRSSAADGTVFTIRLPRAAGVEAVGPSDPREIEPGTLR